MQTLTDVAIGRHRNQRMPHRTTNNSSFRFWISYNLGKQSIRPVIMVKTAVACVKKKIMNSGHVAKTRRKRPDHSILQYHVMMMKIYLNNN
jgi:hypothetical protein